MLNNIQSACRELIQLILDEEIQNELELNKTKKKISARYHLNGIPSNSQILELVQPHEFSNVIEILQKKPVRTISGVAVIAVMTSPAPCPHGICLPCPGGIDSEYNSPQSYMGHEPATMRAMQNDYDPYSQVANRLTQLKKIGHPVNKAELIVMGGSFTARNICYQEWFVRRCLEAMNDFDVSSDCNTFKFMEYVQAENETSLVRNVGMTFETRPDWSGPHEVDMMLKLGGTKVELGVQSLYDFVLKKIERGHAIHDTEQANKILRDSGFKVGFHMMPGLPGSSVDMDLRMFKHLFDDERFKPDYLKIYPTLVTKGTGLHKLWKSGKYEALELEDAVELIAGIKAILPKWVRLQRVQRDIPAWQIEAGVTKSNIRQLAGIRLDRQKKQCQCIRCREAGHLSLKGTEPDNIQMRSESYHACKGEEQFISFEDIEQNILVGFTRLRYPDSPHRPELINAALIRELHVYGPLVSIGQKAGEKEWQHRGYGEELLREAEDRAKNAGYGKLAVISGIGVRPYYERLGFVRDGAYMSKLF